MTSPEAASWVGAGTVVATTVRPSPNIWDHPDTYELENLAFDREQQIEALLAQTLK